MLGPSGTSTLPYLYAKYNPDQGLVKLRPQKQMGTDKSARNLQIYQQASTFAALAYYLPIQESNSQHISGCSADGSALAWGARGRGFESRHSDTKTGF